MTPERKAELRAEGYIPTYAPSEELMETLDALDKVHAKAGA